MKRTPINQWPWSLKLGYNQGEIIEGASRQLICAGQTAAGMGLSNIIKLNIYVTDVDDALKISTCLGLDLDQSVLPRP
jgi:enamine deaminase RidA (YjgF/YER057c/UK114 family)